MFENFYSPAEIAEMFKAGKNLCSQAPKEERKIFSSKDPECSQVSVHVTDLINVHHCAIFHFRTVINILSNLETKFDTSSKPEL